eukprot:6664061-Prymnesium_polylepis.1
MRIAAALPRSTARADTCAFWTRSSSQLVGRRVHWSPAGARCTPNRRPSRARLPRPTSARQC